jgi:hypothetical protein
MPSDLTVVPLTRDAANAYVKDHHRHSKPVVGYKFALGAEVSGELVGVAIAGRPVARALDDGRTLEVLRVATNGHRNANSFLYGAVSRTARAMGYEKLVTYTLQAESGSSLRASGWVVAGYVRPRNWNTPSRPRDPAHHDEAARLRWERAA